MPAYCSAMVTASSHGGALGGTYTATLGAFSSGTASMLLASISPRMAVTWASSTGSTLKIGRAHRLNSSHLVISYAVFCLKKKYELTLDSSTFLDKRSPLYLGA